MGVRLSIEIISPLDAEDRDLLAGVAIMTLAIANHELAKARFPETFAADEDDEDDNVDGAGRDDGPDAPPVPFANQPVEPVRAGTGRATQGVTTTADDALSRGGKGEVWPPDPPRDLERRH